MQGAGLGAGGSGKSQTPFGINPAVWKCPRKGARGPHLLQPSGPSSGKTRGDEQRDGAALPGVQPGEEKLWGDLTVALQGLKGPTKKMERERISKGWSDRTQAMALR